MSSWMATGNGKRKQDSKERPSRVSFQKKLLALKIRLIEGVLTILDFAGTESAIAMSHYSLSAIMLFWDEKVGSTDLSDHAS